MKWFVFYNGQLLLKQQGDNLLVPEGDKPPVTVPEGHKVHEVTMNDGVKVKTFEIDGLDGLNGINDQWKLIGLRDSFNYIPLEDYLCGGKAAQILYWDKHSRYCPTCGVPTVQETPIMKKCPKCGLEMYPPIATAIIVLIQKGDEILLVHNRAFKRNYYGLVAGFLEAGESLEQCVHREVKEETGLTIKNLQYFGSQTWPYPSGLMVGFTAEYESGTIKLQEDELSAGAFYGKDNLPEIPKKMSIARKLIDWWLAKH
ncbi:MAG: NAD(+) diphosphatase [Bacteroidaceae bacterium]|nr:NAD(+) diphosphatase [Bacteroidaceae bacterium]